MTIEELLRDSLNARVQSPPELPGLYGSVHAGAVRLRRRRRVGTVVTACAVVVVIAVPVGLAGGSARRAEPSAPSSGQTTRALPLPSASAGPLPSSPPPSSQLSTSQLPGPASVAAPPSPDLPLAAPAAFPVGSRPALPLLVVDGQQVSLREGNKTYDLGALSGPIFGVPVTTPYGIVFNDGAAAELITPDHRLTNPIGFGLNDWSVSPDGRYIAWGRTVDHGTSAVTGQLGLYDLEKQRVLDVTGTAHAASVAGWVSGGRVVVSPPGEPALWDPSTGGLTTPVADATELLPVGGHTLVVYTGGDANCRQSLLDTVSGKRVGLAGCRAISSSSPDGSRLLSGQPTADLGPTTLLATVDGRVDNRLTDLLSSKGLRAEDAAWIDDSHVQVDAFTFGGRDDYLSRSYVSTLTCSVPLTGSVTCERSAVFGPVSGQITTGGTVAAGANPYIVRRPGP